jgi:hypothetical protein
MSDHHTLQILPDGTLLDGIYEIEGLLGSGGFGKTYRVFDRQLGRRLAIKEFFPAESAMRAGHTVRPLAETKRAAFEKGLESFGQEARHLASFTHPNIVKVHRTFDGNGTSYIVLDYIEGIDLEDWLSGLGAPPTQAELDRLAGSLLSALESMHKAHILHRDIAPRNIRIRNRDGAPVLLDFGLAKSLLPQESAQSSAVIVAHGYAPTESYATGSKLLGPWTDLYGLAAVLYRALTGRPPLTSPERLFGDSMVPAVSLPVKAGYRESFLDGIDWGLALNPADRPQTVADWRATLLDGNIRAKPGKRRAPEPDPAATAIVPYPAAEHLATPAPRQSQKRGVSYGLIAIGVVLLIGGSAVLVGPEIARLIGPKPEPMSAASVREAQEKAEAQRLQAERNRAEAEQRRLVEEKRIQDDRNAAEARRREDEKNAAEAKRREDEKNAAEARRREDEKNAAEARRREDEKNAVEAKRREDEKNAAEAKRREDEKNAAEARRREDEKNAAEARRREDEKNAAEARRIQDDANRPAPRRPNPPPQRAERPQHREAPNSGGGGRSSGGGGSIGPIGGI